MGRSLVQIAAVGITLVRIVPVGRDPVPAVVDAGMISENRIAERIFDCHYTDHLDITPHICYSI